LSNGRLDFGVGRGYLGGEFAGFGVNMDDSTTLFRESLQIIQKAWTEECVTFNGKHFQLENVRIAPKPVQRPCPPLLVAAVSPSSLTWAAEQGLRIMTGPFVSFDTMQVQHAQYRADLERNGFDRALYAECPLQRNVLVADSTEEAR